MGPLTLSARPTPVYPFRMRIGEEVGMVSGRPGPVAGRPEALPHSVAPGTPAT